MCVRVSQRVRESVSQRVCESQSVGQRVCVRVSQSVGRRVCESQSVSGMCV